MPWASVTEPSLGIALLQGALEEAGIWARARYLNVHLLRYIKSDTYLRVADVYAANDFVFAQPIDGAPDKQQLDALNQIAAELLHSRRGWNERWKTAEEIVGVFERLRAEIIPEYIEWCAEEILADRPTLVGLTCLFDQTVASLALAATIKKHDPSVTVVLGGYALHGAVGDQIGRVAEYVDCVFQGPGEQAIVNLAQISNEANPSLPPTLSAGDEVSMDEYPLPRFSDFFSELRALESRDGIRIRAECLPIEASRGCWWGQLHHCTFCGIDDETMRYRHRTAQSVRGELISNRNTYGIDTFRFVDYILPHSFYNTLLPQVQQDRLALRCEIKANIGARQAELLEDAGFVEVQPGIESFSTPVLKLMKKGTSGIQNVLCLKLGRQRGIRILYNLLYGFPGEAPEFYAEMIRQLPLLYHLDPPENCMEVLTTRFAPLRENADNFGIERRQHDNRYRVVFSEEWRAMNSFDLDDYCYYFERGYELPRGVRDLHRLVDIQVEAWREASLRGATLTWKEQGKGLLVRDFRFKSSGKEYQFNAAHLAIFKQCNESIVSVQNLTARDSIFSAEERSRAFEDLLAARLLYVEGRRALALGTIVE